MTNLEEFPLLDETPGGRIECPTGGTALTVTLNPKWYEYKTIIQYQKTKVLLSRLAKRYKLTFLYLVPELTEGGNIHYHGVYKCINDNARKLFLKSISRNIGYLVTKFIDNEIKWDQYIHKDKLWIDFPQYERIQYGQGVDANYTNVNKRKAMYDFFNIQYADFDDTDFQT